MCEVLSEFDLGLICGICGSYFTSPNGHPAACDQCWHSTHKDFITKDDDGDERIQGTPFKKSKFPQL